MSIWEDRAYLVLLIAPGKRVSHRHALIASPHLAYQRFESFSSTNEFISYRFPAIAVELEAVNRKRGIASLIIQHLLTILFGCRVGPVVHTPRLLRSFKAIRALHKGDELADKVPTIATKDITAPLSSGFVQAVPEIVEILAPDTDAAPTVESTTKKHFLNDALYQDVEKQKFQLQQAIRSYEKMTAGSPLKAGLDLKSLTTWDDVCAEVDHARERYEDAKGVFATIKKGFSKLGKQHEAVNAWMALLPSSNEYLSLMCGGLKLVISAAGRLKEMDDTAVMALTEIPSLLLDTQEVVDLFAKAAQGCHYKTSMNTNTEVRALQATNLETLEKVKYLEGVITSFLSANALIDPNMRALRLPPQSVRKAASSEDMIMIKERARSRKALLEALDTKDSTTPNDISVNLRMAWALSKDTQSRIMALMQDPKLHRWIVTPHSTAPFVNGNCSAAAQRSPMPYRAHPPQRPRQRPAGMLRNLIAQLLLAYPNFELTTVRKIRSLDYEDIDDLCDIFERLIAQVPGHIIVFCIIDAVGVFEEDKAQRRDARTVMETLVDLTEVEEGMCTFKLLATCSWNSTSLYKVFENQENGLV
ncbi:hypothetical protein BU23DRAFT_629457 [Bimuria novae-zelandiae CBS 107.79]|uniref:Uncharacterized protein n=1 Tax=Bimuria novae-zelandiae CBS 107.79 TaxID=1447943 RepID=A0A6A5UM01_9PLEO|nr:hypothetical protein BU23DRAFT_629457 [Bimuria novae-zelandiae CBS 107.79]